MDLEATFAYGPITAMQRDRTAQIAAVLSGGPRADAQPEESGGLDYAFAHHLLEGAEHAARAGDRPAFAWYATASTYELESLVTTASVSRHIIAAPPLAELR